MKRGDLDTDMHAGRPPVKMKVAAGVTHLRTKKAETVGEVPDARTRAWNRSSLLGPKRLQPC